jgi:uncharacterized protein (DUF2461 family)
MPRGGKREGSGRKQGQCTNKTKQIRDKAIEDGITPLEVMLDVMRKTYAEALTEQDPVKKAIRLKAACDAAKDAAPYVHPKLANIQHAGDEEKPIQQKIIVEYV